jgi:hypothetical protein
MITAPVRWVRRATAPSAVGIASRGAKVTVAGASKVSASSRACRRTVSSIEIKLCRLTRLVRDALVGYHCLGRVGGMLHNEQKNQIQPHEHTQSVTPAIDTQSRILMIVVRRAGRAQI